MNVAVVGMGKIGLPLSVQIAGKGHRVVGLDINAETVATILDGREPFPGEPELGDRIRAGLANGSFTATTDERSAVADADVVIVVVPLVVDEAGLPDYGALDAATKAIAPVLKPGALVSYETTLPVGATRQRFAPALAAGSGLRLGVDLFVSHSPERVSSGTIFKDLRVYPKLVGGIDPASARRATEFYESALEFDARPELSRPNGVWDVGSAEAAEMTKLAETTYRDLNIAFANELAKAADEVGIDVQLVIEAANSQPYSHIHRPGVAVGGHCIPVYPWFLLHSAAGFELPRLARSVNSAMPSYAADKLGRAIGGLSGKTIAILGLAYRGGVKESAFSGAFDLVRAVQGAGGRAVVHDPLFEPEEIRREGLEPYELGEPADAAILQAEHAVYRRLRPSDLGGATTLLDGRGVVAADTLPGVRVLRLGSPEA